MEDKLLLGIWRCVLPVPPQIWQRILKGDADLGFMSPDHHRVRDLTVLALPAERRPLPPEWISRQLGLPQARVVEILEELERNLTFLFRNPAGEVTWAYPVTVDPTPHRITFSTGERVNAA
jgi:hypothetical protein